MQHLARQVQSQGRGNDTMLVHMTPREVGGLQALARANGGSLTVNPHTGLAEAGFLDSILPMVLGAVLTPLTGGLINPATAGLLVGGGTALATGDISKGLMAGLGAFGGAGIGSALGGLGAGAAEAASPLVTGATGAGTGVGAAGAGTALSGASSAAFDAATGELLPEAVSGIPGSAGLLSNAANASTQSILAGGTAPSLTQVARGLPEAANIASAATPYNAPSISQGLTDIGAGIDKLGQPGGLDKLWAGMGQQMGPEWGRMAGLAGIAAPMLMQQPQGYTPPQYKGSPFTLTPRKPTGAFDSRPGVSSERTYFDPVNPVTGFTPPYASGGSVKRMADGGSAERTYNFNRPAQPVVPTNVAASLPPPQTGFTPMGPGMGGILMGLMARRNAALSTPPPPKPFYPGGLGTPTTPQVPQAAQALQTRQPVVPPMGLPSSAERDYGFANRVSFAPRGKFAAGGETLRDGSFILDARTVSEIGNGSSNAGQERLAHLGGKPIRGPGDGVSDSIRANIGGRQEARVARDEVKFEPETVARIGGGDARKGTQKLYALMRKAQQARKAADRGEDTRVARGLGAL